MGTSLASDSSGPASSSSTRHAGFSLSLLATTAPAEPPPVVIVDYKIFYRTNICTYIEEVSLVILGILPKISPNKQTFNSLCIMYLHAHIDTFDSYIDA